MYRAIFKSIRVNGLAHAKSPDANYAIQLPHLLLLVQLLKHIRDAPLNLENLNMVDLITCSSRYAENIFEAVISCVFNDNSFLGCYSGVFSSVTTLLLRMRISRSRLDLSRFIERLRLGLWHDRIKQVELPKHLHLVSCSWGVLQTRVTDMSRTSSFFSGFTATAWNGRDELFIGCWEDNDDWCEKTLTVVGRPTLLRHTLDAEWVRLTRKSIAMTGLRVIWGGSCGMQPTKTYVVWTDYINFSA